MGIKYKDIEKQEKPKNTLDKIWNFLWKDNSLLGWICSFLVAFLFVKFIIFPLLSLILGTSLPLVVVESYSMHHQGSFIGSVIQDKNHFDSWWQSVGDWYEQKGIEKQETSKWSFKTGFDKGDIMVIKGKEPEQLKKGDVIVFNAGEKHPIIHRIVKVELMSDGERVFSTKGDNNLGQLISEKNIPENAIIGKAVVRVPKLGWIKLAFVEFINFFRG